MNSILLQIGGEGGSGITSVIFLVGMFAVMYFFMIRPQQKRQKEAKSFRESLKEGQEVVTAGGIFGKILSIKDDVVSLEISKSTVIKIERSSIASKSK
ncbi:MAG: preprotein translocase subunit YajC [Cytophagales bacterium]|nr:preprotein translocase subunit YajC [Cytophagales bacterium]